MNRAWRSFQMSVFSVRGWRVQGPWGMRAPRSEWRTHMLMRAFFLVLPSVLWVWLLYSLCVEANAFQAGNFLLIVDRSLQSVSFHSDGNMNFFLWNTAFVFALNLYSMIGFFVLCIRRGNDIGWTPFVSAVMTLLFPIGFCFFAFKPSVLNGAR